MSPQGRQEFEKELHAFTSSFLGKTEDFEFVAEHFWQASRVAAFDRAIEIANEWANSTSCTSHDENPCCHVRTGAGISDRLTRERDGDLNG